MPRVYNIRQKPPIGTVLVDRRTVWGNPFVMHGEQERDSVCDQFAAYAVKRSVEEPDWLEPLRGCDLMCWCAPKRCHADTLLRLANEQRHAGGG